MVSCAAGRWGTSSAFIFLWDVETGEKKSEIEVPDFPSCSTFSPDGSTLAIGTTGFGDKAVFIYLWDIHENVEIAILEIVTLKTPYSVEYVKFSPDGTALAAGIGDRSLITLWDVVTRRETSRLDGYGGGWSSASFAFTPDSMILAGPGIDEGVNWVYLWNVSNEERKKISELHKFAGVSPNGTIYTVEIQPDAYFLWTLSPEDVFMEVAAHGKLATSWADFKMPD